MNKLLIIVILCCVVIVSSCSNNKDNTEKNNINETQNNELIKTTESTVIETAADEGENIPNMGGYDDLARKYIDFVYNIYYGTLVVGQEKTDQWVDNVFLKQSPEAQESIPPLYQMIQYFSVKKEELISVNNQFKEPDSLMRMPEYVINALFDGNDSTMKQSLVSPLALYHEGEIYTWNDITLAITNESNTDINKKIHNIPKDIIESYINRMSSIFEENGFTKYMQEDVDVINSYLKN